MSEEPEQHRIEGPATITIPGTGPVHLHFHLQPDTQAWYVFGQYGSELVINPPCELPAGEHVACKQVHPGLQT